MKCQQVKGVLRDGILLALALLAFKMEILLAWLTHYITTCTKISIRPEINFNLGFIFFFLKVHSWINLSILLRKSNHQIVDKKEQSFEFSSKL